MCDLWSVRMAIRYVFVFMVILSIARVVRSAAFVPLDSNHRPSCRPFTNCTAKEALGKNSYRYEVNGQQLIIDFLDGHYFTLWCNSNSKEASMLSDDFHLPAFSQPVTVDKVTFKKCIVPRGSYYDALKAFKVNVTGQLALLQLPAEPKLNVQHLRGLHITNLKINAVDSSNPPQAAFDFLDEVSGLHTLDLTNVVPEPEALNRLPTTLETLRIVRGRLPAPEQLRNYTNGSSWIERLKSLRLLYLVESAAFEVENPGAKLILPQLSSLPNLTSVSFYHVPMDEKGLSNWLKGSAVKQLILNSCGLSTLPITTFNDVHLIKITLANNELTVLQEGLFTPLRASLTELDLSNNQLQATNLKSAVGQLEELKTLKVNENPLGSLCGNSNLIRSRISAFLPTKLQWLELAGTGATRICSDWISGSHQLMYIDLSENQIVKLEYSDLEMMRISRGTVTLNLTKNKLREIKVSAENYNSCLNEQNPSTVDESVVKRVPVELQVDTLTCDCNAYWFREVLRSCSLLTLRNDVACDTSGSVGSHETLLEYGPDEISCPFNDYCMPVCLCSKRLRDNATVMQCKGKLPQPPRWPRGLIALHVEPGMLDHVPRLDLVELHAANNSITKIDTEDIPGTLRKLNVSNNLISHISVEAARTLNSNRANMSLAGNPLACDCSDVPAFSHLKDVVFDWNSTYCADLSRVAEKTENELCSSLLLPILFGVAVPLLFLVVAVLAYQRFLPDIKQFLFSHNLCLSWIFDVDDTIDDPNKTHDVFLSYSYKDLALLQELKSGLERLGYSTIEHENDWGPGESVLNQIANSVLKARRTLLLVSDNYAVSDWTKQEFQVAHGHAMECRSARVLIIRCNLKKPQALPEDLQQYLHNNTYLDWDDRNFWVKLCRVMPPLHYEVALPGPQDLNPPSSLLKEDLEKNQPLLQIAYPHISN